jgi:hypothetical protein
MSLEQLAEKLERKTSRVLFLKRISVGTAAALGVMLGFPNTAKATYPYRCCDLCEAPSGTCQGPCNWWSWDCCDWNTYPVEKLNCIECYHTIPHDCNNACSQVTVVGICATA